VQQAGASRPAKQIGGEPSERIRRALSGQHDNKENDQMIGRRAVIGLSLLCALLFSAIVAQGASAATNGQTAVTCVPVEAKKGDFEDAHCDKNVGTNLGSFAHKALTANPTTEVEGTNAGTKNSTKESTSAVLKGEAALAKVEITCTGVASVETIENKLVGEHHEVVGKGPNAGGGFDIKYTGCTVQKPSTKCTIVGGAITAKATAVTSETIGKEKNEMGVVFSPEVVGGATLPFVEISFAGGAECALNGQTFPVQGSAAGVGTPPSTSGFSGATVNFTDARTTETLKFGGKPAGLDSVVTVKMKGGNPIATTTPPFTVAP
jgi:hypothetical protein